MKNKTIGCTVGFRGRVNFHINKFRKENTNHTVRFDKTKSTKGKFCQTYFKNF